MPEIIPQRRKHSKSTQSETNYSINGNSSTSQEVPVDEAKPNGNGNGNGHVSMSGLAVGNRFLMQTMSWASSRFGMVVVKESCSSNSVYLLIIFELDKLYAPTIKFYW